MQGQCEVCGRKGPLTDRRCGYCGVAFIDTIADQPPGILTATDRTPHKTRRRGAAERKRKEKEKAVAKAAAEAVEKIRADNPIRKRFNSRMDEFGKLFIRRAQS